MSRSGAVEATVQVGDMEIHYVCTGRGPTVLVLQAPGGGDVDERLMEGWSERFRVIGTRLPADEAPGPRILALVEGMGLERPPVLLVGGDGAWRARVIDALNGWGDVVGTVHVLGDVDPFKHGD